MNIKKERATCDGVGVYVIANYCPKDQKYILWGVCKQCQYNNIGMEKGKIAENHKCLWEEGESE